MKRPISYILVATIFTLTLSACGGARSANHNNSTGNTDFINAIDVTPDSYISWQPPTTYLDSSPLPLSAIGGYKIYVGENMQNMILNTEIKDSNVTTFSFDALGKGIRYIAVTCFAINLAESNRFSNIIIVNII